MERGLGHVQLWVILWSIYPLKNSFSSSKKRVPLEAGEAHFPMAWAVQAPSNKHCSSRLMGPKPWLCESSGASPCIRRDEWRDGCPQSPPLSAPGEGIMVLLLSWGIREWKLTSHWCKWLANEEATEERRSDKKMLTAAHAINPSVNPSVHG